MNDYYYIAHSDSSWFIRRIAVGYDFCLLDNSVVDWRTSKNKFEDLAAELPSLYRVPDSSVLLKLGELP